MELLVVIAIIGILVAMLLPAVQSSREASRRISCVNNMKQLGIAMHNYLAANGHFPSGSISKANPEQNRAPHTMYRWSALALITPFMENQAAHDAINFDLPMYDYPSLVPTEENVPGIRIIIPEFLCPSDQQIRVEEDFGPTNYAVSVGVGLGTEEFQFVDKGTPFEADGLFAVNSKIRAGQISDGLSKTAMASESVLGQPTDGAGHDPVYDYKSGIYPITEGGCNAANGWNSLNPRGFSWANGEFRCTLYNHFFLPNSEEFDCIGAPLGFFNPSKTWTPYGWKAARSLHPGGVNVAMADGSVRFVHDSIREEVWHASATIAGEEPDSDLSIAR